MRRARLAPAAALLAAASLAACTQTVAGSAAPAAPDVPVKVSTPTVALAGDGGLDADAVPDECLLNAAEFGRLVGHAVRPPVQDTVRRGDGSSGSSCIVTAGAEPIAMINVYRPRSGPAGAYVNVTQHPLTGVGDTAGVVTTDGGAVLQLAARDYLVTILVSGGSPTDDAWRAAAGAALERLPG